MSSSVVLCLACWPDISQQCTSGGNSLTLSHPSNVRLATNSKLEPIAAHPSQLVLLWCWDSTRNAFGIHRQGDASHHLPVHVARSGLETRQPVSCRKGPRLVSASRVLTPFGGAALQVSVIFGCLRPRSNNPLRLTFDLSKSTLRDVSNSKFKLVVRPKEDVMSRTSKAAT